MPVSDRSRAGAVPAPGEGVGLCMAPAPVTCTLRPEGAVWVHGGENMFHQGIRPWDRGGAPEGHREVQSDRHGCSSPCPFCPQECQMPPAASTSLWPAAPHCR